MEIWALKRGVRIWVVEGWSYPEVRISEHLVRDLPVTLARSRCCLWWGLHSRRLGSRVWDKDLLAFILFWYDSVFLAHTKILRNAQLIVKDLAQSGFITWTQYWWFRYFSPANNYQEFDDFVWSWLNLKVILRGSSQRVSPQLLPESVSHGTGMFWHFQEALWPFWSVTIEVHLSMPEHVQTFAERWQFFHAIRRLISDVTTKFWWENCWLRL